MDSWIALTVAILFGVLGTISMKLAHGFTHLRHVFLVVIFYCISFVALTFAIKHLDLGVVYAVWSGVGTLLVAAIGVMFFNESISIKKILFLLLIVVGVVGIH
jgi:small multidrug resistance pump